MIFIISALIACSGGQVEETPVAEQPAQTEVATPAEVEAPAESQVEDASVAPATQPEAATTTAAQ
jgi:hypothetical protein